MSETGILKSQKLVEKVKDFSELLTVKELRAFCGLIEFQRKFMKDCSGVMKLLSVWTGKERSVVIEWTKRMNEAF